jgi:hypothetical protein
MATAVWHNIPEDHGVNIHNWENFKSDINEGYIVYGLWAAEIP